jgi:hypothetical protein
VTSTVEFLRRVLPDEGWYCAWQLEGKRNRFFESVEDLARFILDADERKTTAYHAVNSFRNGTRRTGENARGSRSFYLDLDAGPGKPYLDQPAALAALRSFCGALSLPPPTLVNSGYGLHVYWPLDRTVEPDTWRRYASGLKSLCATHGLYADPARSADIASILRTPGTHNRKNGQNVPVVAGLLTGPFNLEPFEVFINAGTREAGRSPHKSPPLADAIGDLYGDEPSSCEAVADQCRQLSEMRACRGRLPEPVWHACLGVLAHCTEGDRFGHEWSAGDERYDAGETQAKLDRQRALGPTTCARFESLNPKGCEGCPFKGTISSPIQLGRVETVQNALAEVNSPSDTGTTLTGVQALPKGFAFKGDSLVFQTQDKNQQKVDAILVKHRLELVNVQFGEMGGDHAYVFKQKLPHEPEHEFSVMASSFLGQGGRGEMAKHGANILEWNHFVKYVMGAVDIYRDAHRTMVRYEQFGWKGDEAFLYGQVLYTKASKQAVLSTHDLQVRSAKRGVGPTVGGSIERWTAAANMLFARGLETQSIALLASFAAPLIRFQERDEGGAVLHLMSSKSAQGKTTALIAAASVWGQIDAFRIKKDDTVIGRLLVLATLSNLPVLYDEIMTRDPDAIYDFVVSFTNGADRTRATRTGEIKHNEARWQTLMLSAGNTSLREVLASGDKPDTQAHRVMELEAVIPPEIAKHYSEEIKDNLRKNAGYAGDIYIDYVVQNLDAIKKLLHDVTDKVRSDTQLPQEYRFWVRTIGAIVCASLIVKKLGLVEFSPDRIYSWIKGYVRQHRAAGSTHHLSEIENLAKFYNDHISSCLPVAGPYIAGRQLNMDIRPVGKLYMRREQTTLKLFMAIGPFRDWCIKNGIHFKGLVDVLFEKHVIKNKNRFVTLGAGTPLSAGQTRCLEIDLAHEDMTHMMPEPEKRV